MSDAPAPELGAENEAHLDRLRRALAAASNFQLVILEIPEGPLRPAVMTRLLAWSGHDGVPTLDHVVVVPERFREEVLSARPHGVILEGLDGARSSDAAVEQAFGTLNWQRDRLRRELGGPLVLMLSARGVAKLFERAPDLATWRAHSCRIRAIPPVGTLRDFDSYPGFFAASSDPLDLDVAEAALAAAEKKGAPPNTLAKAWLAAARARERAGDDVGRQEALTAAERHVAVGVDPDVAADAMLLRIVLDLKLRRPDDARRRLGELETLGRDAPSPFAATWARLLGALIAGNEGRWQEAASAARAAVELADRHEMTAVQRTARTALIGALLHLDDPEAAYAMSVELTDLVPGSAAKAESLALRAQVQTVRGRLDLALRDLEEAVQLAVSEALSPQLRAYLAGELATLAARAATTAAVALNGHEASQAAVIAAGAAAGAAAAAATPRADSDTPPSPRRK